MLWRLWACYARHQASFFSEPYLNGSLCGETILFLFWIYLTFVIFVFDLFSLVYSLCAWVSLFFNEVLLLIKKKKKSKWALHKGLVNIIAIWACLETYGVAITCLSTLYQIRWCSTYNYHLSTVYRIRRCSTSKCLIHSWNTLLELIWISASSLQCSHW